MVKREPVNGHSGPADDFSNGHKFGSSIRDKTPDPRLQVKEKNMNTIYIKTEENVASLDVAAPTSAMVKGGTELRLFITVIFLLFAFVFPTLLLVFNFVKGLLTQNVYKAGASLSALIFTLLPLYVTWRYSFGFANSLFMSLRGYITPFLFIYAVAPEDFIQDNLMLTIGMALFFIVALEWYRGSCRPPAKPSSDKSNANLQNGKAEHPTGSNGSSFSEESLRILLIGDAVPPKVDGVSTFAEHAMELLLAKGHELHLITSIQGDDVFFETCKVTRLPGMATPISPGHSISLPLPSVLYYFTKFKPHCVHLFEVSPLNLACFVYCHLADIPVSFSHHTRLDLYINIVTPQFPQWINKIILFTLERTFYPLCDAHLCVSNVLFEKVKNRGTKNVSFWHSGVGKGFDRSKFDVNTRMRFSDGDVALPLVCHVGRLGPEKNSDEIPEICYETYKIMNGQVRFAIVGGGIMKDQVQDEMMNKYNVRTCTFPGYLRGLPLEQAYASCDVFFSPSTTEGFPLVFLEAMASGLAVVGPIAGGIPDEFTEGVEGCLYDPHDAKSAALAIKRAIDAGSAMRDRAYEKGKEFTWERSIDELEQILKMIVKAKRSSGWKAFFNSLSLSSATTKQHAS